MTIRPLLLLFALLAASFARAESHSLAPYVNDDTLLVARVRIAPLLERIVFEQWFPDSEAPLYAQAKKGFGQLRGAMQLVQGFGIERAELIVAIADIRPQTGPLLVLTLKEGNNPQATAMAIRAMLPSMKSDLKFSAVVDSDGQRILLASRKSLDRYQSLAATPRPDLLGSFGSAEKGPAIVVAVSPGKESRRVIRELWPTLRVPFAELTGPLLADRLQHVVVTLDLEQKTRANLLLTTTDEFSAKRLASLTENGIAYLAEIIGTQKPELASVVKEAVPLFMPLQSGIKVSLTLAPQEDRFQEVFREAMLPALADAHERTQGHQLMNQMKQIALAFHNYHDSNDCFPAPAAICNEQGKPLLSWRVALLPYLEGSDLFSRFHLDEPWDSPHNLNLAKEMPAVYADAMSPELAPKGKTTFLRPIYAGGQADPSLPAENPIESSYRKKKHYRTPGIQFKDMIDGTSNTILFAQVAPEFAQPWTKPADWRVDLENPAAKLQTTVRKRFVAAWADGSARMTDLTASPPYLRAVITHAEGTLVPKE